VCATTTETGCLTNGCGDDVMSWQVDYFCPGNSPNCTGGAVVSRQAQATAFAPCDANEICSASLDQCVEAVQCSSEAYCDPDTGLCWMNEDSAYTYTQAGGVNYCNGLDLGGSQSWTLPTNAQAQGLMEGCASDFCDAGDGPGLNGCYWPTGMGTCSNNLWLDNTSSTYWIPVNASISIATGSYRVRCVTPMSGN
jgi:hypothetical protein